MSKKTKSQSKKLKSFKGFFDGLEGYTKVLMPYLLVFAIAFAPFGALGVAFLSLFFINAVGFSLSSLSWKDNMKNITDQIVSAEEAHKREMEALNEQLKTLEEEKESLKQEINSYEYTDIRQQDNQENLQFSTENQYEASNSSPSQPEIELDL